MAERARLSAGQTGIHPRYHTVVTELATELEVFRVLQVIEGNWLLHRHPPQRHGHEQEHDDERQQDHEVASCPRRQLPIRGFRFVPWRGQASRMDPGSQCVDSSSEGIPEHARGLAARGDSARLIKGNCRSVVGR